MLRASLPVRTAVLDACSSASSSRSMSRPNASNAAAASWRSFWLIMPALAIRAPVITTEKFSIRSLRAANWSRAAAPDLASSNKPLAAKATTPIAAAACSALPFMASSCLPVVASAARWRAKTPVLALPWSVSFLSAASLARMAF